MNKHKSDIQSVLFNKNVFTEKDAEKWMKKYNLHPIKQVHITKNFLRYRQKDPTIFKHFITEHTYDPNVELVIGFY
jgi:hypothetical protein